MRKTMLVGVLVTFSAMLLGACTPGGPAQNTWRVKPASVQIVDDEDNDGGDEPYVIQIGFRSKLGVVGSASASIVSQCPWSIPPFDIFNPNANSTPQGGTYNVPAGAADIVFPMVQNLDIGDVLFATAPLEIFGTMSFAMERDAVTSGCAITDLLTNAVVPVLAQSLELLIARSAVPPTQEDLINLIVSNIGNFLLAAANLLGAVLEGLGNPDDIMGIAAQIHLPTQGAFTDLLNTGLVLAGLLTDVIEPTGQINIPDSPQVLKIKIGNLLPSSASFDFPTEGGHYILNTVISG